MLCAATGSCFVAPHDVPGYTSPLAVLGRCRALCTIQDASELAEVHIPSFKGLVHAAAGMNQACSGTFVAFLLLLTGKRPALTGIW